MIKITRKQSNLVVIWLLCILTMLTISGILCIINYQLFWLEQDLLLLSIKPPTQPAPVIEEHKEIPKTSEVKVASRSGENRNVHKIVSKYNKAQASEIIACMDSAYREFNLRDYGMSFECFVAQACVESKFNPRELGRDNDIGLYQIIPSTARDINKSYFKIEGFKHDMLYDIDLNCRFGAYYLSYIFSKGYSVGDTLEIYNKWLKGLNYTNYRNKVFAVEKTI